jgi:hypothetical protein
MDFLISLSGTFSVFRLFYQALHCSNVIDFLIPSAGFAGNRFLVYIFSFLWQSIEF